jgi:hypothetical protein
MGVVHELDCQYKVGRIGAGVLEIVESVSS